MSDTNNATRNDAESNADGVGDDPPEFPMEAFNEVSSGLGDFIGPDFANVIAEVMQGPDAKAVMGMPEIKAIHKAAARGEISAEETQVRVTDVFKRAVGGGGA